MNVIERAYVDETGTMNRRVIATDLSKPVGIAVGYSSQGKDYRISKKITSLALSFVQVLSLVKWSIYVNKHSSINDIMNNVDHDMS